RGEVYRWMENGVLLHINDLATLGALAYVIQDIVSIPDADLKSHVVGLPLTRWITAQRDNRVYFLQKGKRYVIPDEATLNLTGASVGDVSYVSDDYLNSFPLANDPIDGLANLQRPVRVDAARWDAGTLWLYKADGQTVRWTPGKAAPIIDDSHTAPRPPE